MDETPVAPGARNSYGLYWCIAASPKNFTAAETQSFGNRSGQSQSGSSTQIAPLEEELALIEILSGIFTQSPTNMAMIITESLKRHIVLGMNLRDDKFPVSELSRMN